MPDPSILVTLHSLDDASLAPDGCSSIYVLEPTPNLSGKIDWSRERDRIMGSLREKVTSLGYPTEVVVEEIYDPQDWERMGMEQGTPFALAHTFFQTGPFRPNNVDKRVPGLVFTGSSTLPVSVFRWCSSRANSPPNASTSSAPADRHISPEQRHRRTMRSMRLPQAIRRQPPMPTTHLLPAGPVTLDESYALCKDFNKRHGTTYYWSTKVLPKVKQHHVHALYAFARYADDIVDEIPSQGGRDVPTEVRADALADFGNRFFADVEAGRSDDPVLKAVVHTVRAFDIDIDAFHRFLRSMTMDLTVESYETWDDLLVYMDGSAAVIGEMMLPILEPSDYDAALPHARDLATHSS